MRAVSLSSHNKTNEPKKIDDNLKSTIDEFLAQHIHSIFSWLLIFTLTLMNKLCWVCFPNGLSSDSEHDRRYNIYFIMFRLFQFNDISAM